MLRGDGLSQGSPGKQSQWTVCVCVCVCMSVCVCAYEGGGSVGLAGLKCVEQAAGLQAQEEQASWVQSEGIWRRSPPSRRTPVFSS